MNGIRYILAASVFVAVVGAVWIAAQRDYALSDAALSVVSALLGAITSGLLINKEK